MVALPPKCQYEVNLPKYGGVMLGFQHSNQIGLIT